MSAAPLLDTHAWIWWLQRDPRLSNAHLDQLDAFEPNERPCVADISLWEVAMLVQLKGLQLAAPLRDWLELASHPRTVRLVPISAAVAAETTTLSRALRDPADRIIVATSRIAGVPLLTYDQAILRSRLAERWVPRLTGA